MNDSPYLHFVFALSRLAEVLTSSGLCDFQCDNIFLTRQKYQ